MSSYWQAKHALIAGGSSGLGLSLVRQLSSQGAHLTLIGRDEQRLSQAADIARTLGSPCVESICTDACNEESIRASLQRFSSDDGNLDLAINAIGQSDRGQLLQLETSELARLFETNILSAFHIAKFCRPALKRSHGSLILVGSLATHLAPAGLGGYAVTKFPLAAMRQQLSAELSTDNIHTMLVCPGPIRREDAGTRYQEQIAQRGLDPTLSKPGGGARVKALDPDWLCRRILQGVQRREREIIVPWKARLAIIASNISPRFGDWLLKKSMSQ